MWEVKMKIDINILKDYIIKVSLNTTIPTINLNFGELGVSSRVRNISNVAMTEGFLKKEAFETYNEIGEIYIKNSKMLLDSIKPFKGIVTLSVNDDQTILKIFDSSRKINNMLAEKSICDNIMDRIPDVKSTVEVDVDISILKQTVSDMNLLKVSQVKFIKEGKNMVIQVGEKNEYDFITNNIITESDTNVNVGVGASFSDVVASLGKNIKILLGDNVPIIFKDDNEFINVSTILAPFMEDAY